MKSVRLLDLDLSDYVKPGDTVCWGQAAAEPLTLTTALMEQRHRIGRFRAFVGMTWSDTVQREYADVIDFASYCAAGSNRQLASAGCLDILPCHYSTLPSVLSREVDVLFLQVSPPGPDGLCSLGLACEYLGDLVSTARVIVAEINDQVPRTLGRAMLPARRIACAVHTSHPPLETRAIPPGIAELEIARRIAGLVEDGATLQVGLGAIPEAVLGGLKGHRNLGIHSGLVGDAVVDLAESGALTNARKTNDPGVSVTGLLAGSRRLADFAHENQGIMLCATSYTHDPRVLATSHRFTAINSAIEVDLTGQINAEVAGGRYVGAVGGAIDFLRGAARSEGGLPIIALTSKARIGEKMTSRIVASLSGPVSTSRADAAIIVTEHGIADLRSLTLSERIRTMIAIAAPEFRDELERAAFAIAGKRAVGFH